MIHHICLRSARSYVGKTVNLHLIDQTVILNVFLESIEDNAVLKYKVAGSKAQFVAVRDVSLIRPVLSWESSTCVQNYRSDSAVVFNEWRRLHKCSAWTCLRDPLGNRFIGSKKCVGCSSLQEAS